MKTYTREEYLKQVAKDIEKLSEYFMNLSKAIECDDVNKMRDLFKKIARIMCINRNLNGFPQQLIKYMDVDFYKMLDIQRDMNKKKSIFKIIKQLGIRKIHAWTGKEK